MRWLPAVVRPDLVLSCPRCLLVLALILVFLPQPSVLMAQEWGTLSGRIVFDGPVPKRLPLELNKDVDYCGKSKPLDESLIVDPATRGLANVVISLNTKRGDDALPIHPEYAKSADEEVRVTNLNCRFEPRVAVLRLGQTLVLENDDTIAHNTLANLTYNQPFNEALTFQQAVRKTFTRAETRPAEITCPIHAWMKGYIVIKEHPYVVVTDAEGRFTIRNLPVGEWEFQFWHEAPKYLSEIRLHGQTQSDRKGVYTVTVKAGENELGDVTVQPELFE